VSNTKKSYAERLQDWKQRNLEIFGLWKAGMTFTAISKIYGLNQSRIAQICHKQTRILNRQAK